MWGEILKKYFYFDRYDSSGCYTDLALERRRADIRTDGVEYGITRGIFGTWESVKITSTEGEKSIGRPCGIYDTFNTGRMDSLNYEEIEDAKEEVAKKLCMLFDELSVCPEKLLIIGLGNPNLTPDSVGTRTALNVKATAHIKEFDEQLFLSLDCSAIAVFAPGVMAESGIETAKIVKGICSLFQPDAVIAVDAIATHSEERLGSTIQISDTGIFPGSGVGNMRDGLNKEFLGAPVIAIGVPTVIDSRVFALQNANAASSMPKTSMFVSPKEIDEIVNVAADIISGGINQAFGISAF